MNKLKNILKICKRKFKCWKCLKIKVECQGNFELLKMQTSLKMQQKDLFDSYLSTPRSKLKLILSSKS